MQQREKILGGVVAALLVIVGANLAWLRVAEMFQFRQDQVEALEKQLRDRRYQEALGASAVQQLADWERRSLPADRELARSAYQQWLVGLVDQVRLSRATVEPQRGTSQSTVYQTLPFTVRGRGTLEQTVRFMHAFYSVDLLHRMREVILKPVENAREMELSFTIEALILNDNPQTELPLGESHRLALGALDDYVKPIVARNMFAAYAPPPPPRPAPEPRRETPQPPPRPSFDPSKFAVLTGIITVGAGHEAWLQLRTTGETLRLTEGQTFEIGTLKGRMVRIGVQHIDVEWGGKTLQVRVGKNLAEATPIGPEA